MNALSQVGTVGILHIIIHQMLMPNIMLISVTKQFNIHYYKKRLNHKILFKKSKGGLHLSLLGTWQILQSTRNPTDQLLN